MRTTGMKRALTGAAIAALAFNASAAGAATTTATAKARILAPLTIANTSDLDFGTIVSGTGAFGSRRINTTSATMAFSRCCAIRQTRPCRDERRRKWR